MKVNTESGSFGGGLNRFDPATGLVTRYDYVPITGSPSDHALASVARPGGTTRFFSYDAAGRNSGRHSSGSKARACTPMIPAVES